MSKSQENLAAYFDDKEHKKESMNTALWELGNSLVAEGRVETLRRVWGDVQQHVVFRENLLNAGALVVPKVWTCGARPEKYHA